LGYLRDGVSSGRINTAHPVYVVETGSGSGKFAFLVLKAVVERLHVSGVSPAGFKFIMTDFVAGAWGGVSWGGCKAGGLRGLVGAHVSLKMSG
jgi:hypothetical protein